MFMVSEQGVGISRSYLGVTSQTVDLVVRTYYVRIHNIPN